MTKAISWDFTDGWILMSIYMAAKAQGVKLDRVIAAADAMNHAVPTFPELSTSLRKLVSARVVELTNDEIAISAEYLPDIERAFDGRGGLFSSPDKGRRWLGRARAIIPEAVPESVLSESKYSEACERYLRR